MNNEYQSAYRENHSTETALLHVQNDLFQAVDKSGAAVLVLLDLLAAFDTLDHAVLLNRLASKFSLHGKVLQWISSYIQGRSQSVQVGDVISNKTSLHFGLPQGSVLGPLLYNLYTTSLLNVISHHDVCFHMYADDMQLYIGFDPKSEGSVNHTVKKLESCLDEVKKWMSDNYLKLNTSKTEIMFMSSRQHLQNTPIEHVTFGEEILVPSTKV